MAQAQGKLKVKRAPLSVCPQASPTPMPLPAYAEVVNFCLHVPAVLTGPVGDGQGSRLQQLATGGFLGGRGV